jgi:hypothetical protein
MDLGGVFYKNVTVHLQAREDPLYNIGWMLDVAMTTGNAKNKKDLKIW